MKRHMSRQGLFLTFGAIVASMLLLSTSYMLAGGQKEKGIMNVAQAVERIRPSIVQITFHTTDLSEDMRRRLGRPFISYPLGTGFLVNEDGYVITARHVIEGASKIAEELQVGQQWQIYVRLAALNIADDVKNIRILGNFRGVPSDVVDVDARHDLALLKLRQNPFKSEMRSGFVIDGKEIPLLFGTVTLNPNRPQDGAAVGISGYPFGEPVLVTNVGWMATSWSFDIKEVPVPGAPEWFRWPDIADVYLADVEVNPGNSGGPVYLIENAAVIGVCVASKPAPVRDQMGNPIRQLFYSSGLTIVVPSRYVIELLRKHNLTWSKSTE